MRREFECLVCCGAGVEYGETCLTCGGSGDEPPVDTCDVCECAMKYKRICDYALSSLYVCSDCRDAGMRMLGNDGVSAIYVSIKRRT